MDVLAIFRLVFKRISGMYMHVHTCKFSILDDCLTVFVLKSYSCICDLLTDVANACDDNNCDHGTCVDHRYYYTCDCDNTYWGQYCNRKY